jgi:hypothetical protein
MNKLSILVFLLLFSSASFSNDLARSIISTYSDVSKYRDSGVVTVSMINLDGTYYVTKKEFLTQFERGGDFKFSWKTLSRDFYSKGGELEEDHGKAMSRFFDKDEKLFERIGGKTYQNFHGETEEVDTLCTAYAGATGISNGAAALAPRYLLARECYEYEHMILPNAKRKGLKNGQEIIETIYNNGRKAMLLLNEKTGLLETYRKETILKTGTKVRTEINISLIRIES